jgi:hypothetical protein
MAKKPIVNDALDQAKSVAGAALAAAAVAATGVVVSRVAAKMREGGKNLEDATPRMQRMVSETVSKPVLPAPKKRAAAKRTAKKAGKRVAARKAAKKSARKKR